MEFLENILKWIYPPVCAACGRVVAVNYGGFLCENCRDAFKSANGWHLHSNFEYKSENGKYFERMEDEDFVCLYLYQDKMRDAIHYFKYHKKFSQGRALAMLLADGFSSCGIDFSEYCCVIPVPIHKNRLRERGFNQSELLVQPLCKRIGVKMETSLVRRIVDTPPQSSLSAAERRTNVENCFELNKKFSYKGKSFIIFDDILTTGSTVRAIVLLLKEAGAKRILCLCLSVAPWRGI